MSEERDQERATDRLMAAGEYDAGTRTDATYDVHRARELAQQFSREMLATVGPGTLEEVNRRNDAEPEGSEICHTHDFCDANEVMLCAFEALFGRPYHSDTDGDLSDAAWRIARNDRFQVFD